MKIRFSSPLFVVLLSLLSQNLYAGFFKYQDPMTQLYGLKDENNKIIISARYEAIYDKDNQALFDAKNKEFEFLVPVMFHQKVVRITRDGTIKFETVFFDNGPDYYENGLTRFLKDYKVGFHNYKGEIVVEASYDFATPFRSGYSYVCNGCHAEYSEKVIYRPLSSYFYGERQDDQMFPDIVGGKWGKIDKTGKVVVPLAYHSIEDIDKIDGHIKAIKIK